MGRKIVARGEDEIVLNPQHLQAAAMLAEGASYSAAAKAAGCSERTIKSWLTRVPGFREEIELRAKESADRLQKLAAHARLDLMDLAAHVGDTLGDALQAINQRGNEDWHTRLKAAELILKHGIPAQPNGENGTINAQAGILIISRDDIQLANELSQNVATRVIDAQLVEEEDE